VSWSKPARVMTTVSPCSTASRMVAKVRAAWVAVTAIMNTYYQIYSAYMYANDEAPFRREE